MRDVFFIPIVMHIVLKDSRFHVNDNKVLNRQCVVMSLSEYILFHFLPYF